MFSILFAPGLRPGASFWLGRRYMISECLLTSPCVASYVYWIIDFLLLFRILSAAHALKCGNGALSFAGGVGFRLAPPRQLGGCVRARIVIISRFFYLFHSHQLVSLIAFAPSLAASPPNPPAALARSAPVPGRAYGCGTATFAVLSGVVTFFTCGCWSLF